MGAGNGDEVLFVVPPFEEMEAVFEDVFCPLHLALQSRFDAERKQKLVSEGTVLHTRGPRFWNVMAATHCEVIGRWRLEQDTGWITTTQWAWFLCSVKGVRCSLICRLRSLSRAMTGKLDPLLRQATALYPPLHIELFL